jgi:hypothetical protein
MESREYESKTELIEAKKKHKELCPKLQELTRDYEVYLRQTERQITKDNEAYLESVK